ncbi:hypothetical protein GW950_00465 [Candidatus Wolfebacteria bacterium]|nr:hypothetical protein [Candidatus Wolfebacteria bacterium]
MRELEAAVSRLETRHLTSLDEDLKTPEVTKAIFKEINRLTEKFHPVFEEGRRNLGKSHGMRNANNVLSHFGIQALQRGDMATAKEAKSLMDEATDILKNMEGIPRDLEWQFDATADQERAEFVIVMELYPYLSINKNMEGLSISSNEDLQMTPQSWLSGLGDATSELGKVYRRNLCERGLSKEDRVAMRERYVDIAEGIREALGRFETAYAMVINNSRSRNFGSTFRGLLGRIDGLIERERDKISIMLDDMAS